MDHKTKHIEKQIKDALSSAEVVTDQICSDHQGVILAFTTLNEGEKLFSAQEVKAMLGKAWDEASLEAYEEGEAHGKTLGYDMCLHDRC